MKKFILIPMLAAGLWVLGGCATSHSQHSSHCSKCNCPEMKASASDSHKCQMCGHADTDHQPAAAAAHQH